MNDPLHRPLRVPSWQRRSRELLAGRDLLRSAITSPRLLGAPRGDGSTVVLVPGFGTGDAVLLPLRNWLRTLNYDARSAGLGRIDGDVLSKVLELIATVDADRGHPVALVGWSLGGVIAREVARERPQLVSRVITFGSPVRGGPKYSAVHSFFSEAALVDIEQRIADRNRIPIRVPITAMWSNNDGIVPPAACYDADSPVVEHVEVDATHTGMGFDVTVWRIIADRLAARLD